MCQTPSDVLIRCQTSSSDGHWVFVCPSKCWTAVSGGVVDGDAAHPDYKYGGMWKNKHALVSAKKPKRKKSGAREVEDWRVGRRWVVNDRVGWGGRVWVCRRSCWGREGEEPGGKKGVGFWKEDDVANALGGEEEGKEGVGEGGEIGGGGKDEGEESGLGKEVEDVEDVEEGDGGKS